MTQKFKGRRGKKIIKERLSECQSVMKDFEKEGAKGDIKAFYELFCKVALTWAK